jgi:hypothetical protein
MDIISLKTIYQQKEYFTIYTVRWGNSDQKLKISFCFYSFSFIIRRKELIFGVQLEQSVLYRLVKVIFENLLLERNYNQNAKSSSKLIRITPFRINRINKLI